VRVTIDDDGPGLPEEVRARLFTPHLTTKANGSGMGLFLAHRIATARYGGRLELAAREAGGTSAVLELGSRRPGPGDEADA
jgi:C4-dicarboxylate-specific signal transduction histidine kinase